MRNWILCSGSLGALLLASALFSAQKAGDAAKGKEVFEQCGVCHNTDTDEKKIGPSLKGLFKKDKLTSGKKANDAYQVALCSLDLSEIYIEVNLIPEATQLAREANEHFQQLGFGYEAAKALVFGAIAASRQGQTFEGIKLFSTARELFIRDKNHVWPSLIDLYEALVLFNEGRLFEARRLCVTAREFFSTSSMRSKAVLAELLLARIALHMNDAAFSFEPAVPITLAPR